MKKWIFILGFLSFAVLSALTHAYAWDALKTDQFTVFYEPLYRDKAVRILSALEYYKHIPERIVGNRCGSLPIVLDDYGQYMNGFANPVYYNIHLINYETADADWLSYVAVHEYTHMAHMTMAGGLPGVFTFLFGNLAGPMLFAPQWTFEAITVYNESGLSAYMGRLNDGAFETYMSICSAAGEFPSLMKATYLPVEFPYGTGMYLFGGEFWNFLAQTYGEEKFREFYKSYSSSIGSYLSPVFPWIGIDRTFDEVFGSTTTDLWGKWKEAEKEKAKGYAQEGERVTFHGDNAGWPAVRGGTLYYARNTVEKTGPFEARAYNEIVALDIKSGASRVISSGNSDYAHPFRFAGNRLYYAVREIRPGYANKSNLSYGYYTVINELNLETGEDNTVLSGDIRAFYVPYAGKIIYSIDDTYKTGSALYEYDLELKENRLLFDSEYLVLALAGNGTAMIASARKDGGNASLYRVDAAKKTFTPIVDTPYYEENPEVYGNRLFFRANYGRVYSAYCYDLETGKISRLTENGSAGTPAYYEEQNEIYFAAAHVRGFDIYKKKAEFKPYTLPADKNDFVMPPLIDEAKLEKGSYLDNLATLFPRVRVPFLVSDGTETVSGAVFDSADAIGDFHYAAGAYYNAGRGSWHYSLDAASYVFSPVELYVYSDNLDFSRDMSSLITGLSLPLFRGIRPGISEIRLNLEHMFYEGFYRRQLAPSAGFSLRWPRFEMSVSLARAFEGAWLGSAAASRQGTTGSMYIALFPAESKISVSGRAAYDPDNSDNVLPRIRGYREAVAGNKGSVWTFEAGRPLFRIRNGLWNPVNFYIEDICGKVFFDAAFGAGTQFSAGSELHAEFKFFNIVPVDIGVRAGITREAVFFWFPFAFSPLVYF